MRLGIVRIWVGNLGIWSGLLIVMINKWICVLGMGGMDWEDFFID